MSEMSPSTTRSRTRVSLFLLLIGLFILVIDQLTKGIVYTHLPVIDPTSYWYPYGGMGVFKDFGGIEFSINHMTNTGAAWGVLGNHQYSLIILRIGLILGLLIYLFNFNHRSSWRFPLILIIAGATGNVIDFFVYGHVIDMFHVVFWGYDFPVFNVADSSISIGITLLFFLSFIEKDLDPSSEEKL